MHVHNSKYIRGTEYEITFGVSRDTTFCGFVNSIWFINTEEKPFAMKLIKYLHRDKDRYRRRGSCVFICLTLW